MTYTEEPFTLRQMAPKRPNRAALIIGIAAAAIVLVGGGAAVALALTNDDDAKQPAAEQTPIANGIIRPDKSCVTTDGTDRREYWDGNGWWAGRVDGEAKEMPAHSVLLLKLNGHQIDSVWICAPR